MSRRAFTERDRARAQVLLSKTRRNASQSDEMDVLYNPQSFKSLHSALGHQSLNLGFMRSNLGSLDSLQKAVIDLVKHRLQAQNVQFPPLSLTSMSWCIPQEQKDEPIWRLLLEDPLLFTADMLETIIALDDWTSNRSDPPLKSSFLYIRTFEIHVSLLRSVLDQMQEQGFDSIDRIHLWQKKIDESQDRNEIFTLRYCGQTTGNPWKRHHGDMYSKLQTPFGRFLKLLGQTAQGIKVLNKAKVQTLASALEYASDDTANLREQILIGLFGDSVLNAQAGGKDVISLFREDRDNFDRLKTKIMLLLPSQTRKCSATELEPFREYAEAISLYVSNNPSTVGKVGVFTARTTAMILRQCTPSVLPTGSAVMVTVGSDLGEEHDDLEDTFWNAGGRSVESVTKVYNSFASWEGPTALETVKAQATKYLAANGYLPFVDLFPWFTKDEKDYLAASRLLRQYMNAAKPMIVLTYGERQTFAAMQSFQDFTMSEVGSWIKMCRNSGTAPRRGLPYLCYFDGQDSEVHDPETAVVLIPSLHPGYISRSGLMREKATRVFVLTSAVAWCAMSVALEIAQEALPTNREDYAKKIIAKLDAVTGPNTQFGMSIEKARRELEDCYQAFNEGRAKRSKAPKLKMPAGVLSRKSVRAQRKSRYGTSANQVQDGVGGWEVSITKTEDFDRNQEFYTLCWKEESGGTSWDIGPIQLSDDVCPTSSSNKRYIYFVHSGIDIRDANDKSLGVRTPLASGRTKAITLPISSIFLTLSIKGLNAAYDFLEHWEELSGNIFAEEVLSSHVDLLSNQSEAYLPSSVFEEFSSCLSLPFPSKVLRYKATFTQMRSMVQPGLPTNASDLLWLLEQFLLDVFPTGGDIDPVSASEHPTYSVYAKLMNFATRPKYKHHPHIDTLKAMAHLSEQGADDRRIPFNIMLLALDILRPGSSQKKKNLRRTLLDGSKIDTSRMVRTIGAGPASTNIVAAVTIPDLLCDTEELGEVDDITDDNASDSEDEDEDDVMMSSAAVGSTGKRSRDKDEHDDESRKRRFDLEHSDRDR